MSSPRPSPKVVIPKMSSVLTTLPSTTSKLHASTRNFPNTLELFNWRFNESQGAMLSTTQIASMAQRTSLPSLPEMVFGANKLKLACYSPTTVFTLEFSAEDALQQVSKSPPDGIKVAASRQWSSSNKQQVEKLKEENYLDDSTSVHDFDWTFTTEYYGTYKLVTIGIENQSSTIPQEVNTGLDPNKHGIPMEQLKDTSDPILWFSQLHLYEDELHDNGIAEISVRTRVMSTYWFCLLRFWLRVDGVLFRVIDNRLYHEFGTEHIIREMSTKEDTWDNVCAKTKGNLKATRDPSEFAAFLPIVKSSLSHILLGSPASK